MKTVFDILDAGVELGIRRGVCPAVYTLSSKNQEVIQSSIFKNTLFSSKKYLIPPLQTTHQNEILHPRNHPRPRSPSRRRRPRRRAQQLPRHRLPLVRRRRRRPAADAPPERRLQRELLPRRRVGRRLAEDHARPGRPVGRVRADELCVLADGRPSVVRPVECLRRAV